MTVILSAIGLKPETALAEASGIQVNRGITVNQYLQTSQENTYALGDCMEFEGRLLPYIAPIAIAARALAKTLLGEPTPVIYPPLPIYIKTPAYPIVVLQPDDPQGEWQIEKDKNSVRALFYHQNKLKGFALGGAFTTESIDWVKKI
jgi:rubredoxin---NAD+ reductase